MSNIKGTVVSCVKTAVAKTEKHSPVIFFGIGCVGVVATAVTAFRAAPKAAEIVEKHRDGMALANEAAEVAVPEDGYDVRIEKARVCAETAKDMAVAMAPTVLLAAGTIVSFGVAFNILNKRYMGAVAWGNAVAESFALYRSRVRDEIGEDMDRHFRYGTEVKITESQQLNEDGTVTTTHDIETNEEDGAKIEPLRESEFARYFDETNDNWDPNPTFNLMFLRAKEQQLTDRLRANKHLFLNDVYEELGFKHTQLGAVVGWIVGEGPDYVDFGLGNKDAASVRTFINGDTSVVLLDFNVHGLIWDKI